MVAALSPNIFAFIWGGRVIMGLGACLITPSVLGLVAALYQGRQRAIAFGTIAGAAALSTLSPLILGIVMDSSGFRLTFAIMAIYFVLVLCCTRLVPRTPLSGNHSRFDVAGTIVAALGMGLALFGVAHLSDWGIVNPQKLCPFTLCGLPPTLPAILIGLVLLGLLVPTERRAQRRGNPLIPAAFVTSPKVRAGLSAVALPFFYMGAVGILATPYLQLVTGFTALQTGMLSLLSGIPMFLLATFLPKLAPHLSSRLIIRTGFIAIACACALMAFGVHAHGVTGALFAGMALGGFGVGAVNSQSNNAVACAVTRKEAEQSGGIQGAARSIGLALGTALAGTFLLLTMAGGFAAQAASAGIDQSYVAPAAETASTLMSDSAFSDEARTWGADAAQVDKLVDVKASAQADAMRLSFGALGLLMAGGGPPHPPPADKQKGHAGHQGFADPPDAPDAAQDHQSVNSAGKVQLHQCYSGTRPAGDSAHLQVQPHRRSGTDRRRDAQRLLQVSGGDEQHGRQKRCSQQGENDRRHRDHPLLVF